MSVAAPIVAKASYDREQIASALYFINANKFVLVTGKEQFRIGQFCKVGRPFKVEVDGWRRIFAEMLHQCGFSTLARTYHGSHRIPLQSPPYAFFKSSFYVCHTASILASSTFIVEFARINVSYSLPLVNGAKIHFQFLSGNFGQYGCAAFLFRAKAAVSGMVGAERRLIRDGYALPFCSAYSLS